MVILTIFHNVKLTIFYKVIYNAIPNNKKG